MALFGAPGRKPRNLKKPCFFNGFSMIVEGSGTSRGSFLELKTLPKTAQTTRPTLRPQKWLPNRFPSALGEPPGPKKKVLQLPRAPWKKFPARFHRKRNLAIMEREAREKREPQAKRAKQEREDRSKHCKRIRGRSTQKSKNHREQDSKSIETASPDTRLKPRVGAARRRLGA